MGVNHVSPWAGAADLVVIAPVTANTVAKMGRMVFCDNLLHGSCIFSRPVA
jgi:phosphopantothenoylcysteine synthetase/decarboxylase